MTRRPRAGRRPLPFFAALGAPRFLVMSLAAAPLAAVFLLLRGYGTGFLVATVANLGLLCLYVVAIELVGRGAAARPQPVTRPTAETAILVAYTLFLFARAAAQATGHTSALPVYDQVDGLLTGLTGDVLRLLWPGGEVPALAGAAVSNLFWLVALPLALFLLLGYRPVGLGFSLARWWVALPCLAVAGILRYLGGEGLAVGGLGGFLGQFFWVHVLTAFAEEFFFRALLQTRLEAATGRGIDAVAVAAFAWVLLRLPALIAQDGFDVTLVGAKALAVGLPSGLAWGYIYLRTRSLAPGVLWRAWPWPAFPF